MKYTVPHYFARFQCTADRCPDTCCAGWQIVIDPRSLRKYSKVKGGFKNRLLNAVDWKKGVFHQCDGRCEFLNEENLCDLYTELGEEGLCRTCRRYPRHVEEFENLREISLSISCPAAAKLILECTEKVHFLSKEKESREECYEDFDFLLFEKLMEAREVLLEIIQDRVQPIQNRAAFAVAFTHDFQRRINRNRIFETEELAKHYQRAGAASQFLGQWKKRSATPEESFQIRRELFEGLWRLEPLRKDWVEYRNLIKSALYTQSAQAYWEQEARFRKYLENLKTDSSGEIPAEIWLEQLLVYFIFTYFCGAVYDGDALSKLKLAVYSVIMIWEQLKYEWTQGRAVDADAVQKAAVRYAREVEHSDENLGVLEKLFRQETGGEKFIHAIYLTRD